MSPNRLFKALLCTVLVALAFPVLAAQAQAVATPSRITQAVNESNLTVLRGNTHPLAQSRFDQGAVADSLPMNRMLLVLKRSQAQEAALDALLDQQQDPTSPNYHQWLTPQQFGQQFGPSDQDVQTITNWLQSHGFTVNGVSNGRTVIEFSGTAGQVRDAFHTEIHRYTVNGADHFANSSDPQIPSALTPVVAGVFTMHNFVKAPQSHVLAGSVTAEVTPGPPSALPQVTFVGSSVAHALAPADFAQIYNLNASFQVTNGFNSRIAVVGRSNINVNDVNGFDSYLPLNTLNRTASPFVILNGPDPGDLGGGEEAEAVLDTSWAGALLANNGGTVALVVSATTSTTDGVDLSELYIIDNDFADVMTESFGDCEANETSAEGAGLSSLAQQAAAEGITYVVSAGDSGAEGCDRAQTEQVASGPLSVNVLASTPYTIAVGGTMFNENGDPSKYWSSSNSPYTLQSALSYIPEDVWNESCPSSECGENASIWAGGGGSSAFFSKPTWQSGVTGIPNDNARDVPDLSLTAAGHDPYLICLDGSCIPNSQGYISFAAIYGTSASAPSFAGIMALVDHVTASRQGQANYVLYRLAAAESLSQCNASNTTTPPNSTGCVFNDVTVGNNAVPGEAGYSTPTASYQSTAGYDLATGLGSVNITNLINDWSTARSLASEVSSFSLTPTAQIQHGSPVTVDVTVASKSGVGGVPSGDVALIANANGVGVNGQQLAGAFTLSNGSVVSSTNLLPGGTYNVTAHYEGDGTFLPSDSAPVSVTVGAESSKTFANLLQFDNQGNLLVFGATSSTFGSGFAVFRVDVGNSAATVSPSQGVSSSCSQSLASCPTGNVTLSSSGTTLPVTTLPLNGQGYAELPSLEVGSYSITATYPGDPSYSSSSGSTTFTIAKAPTTLSAAAPELQLRLGSNQIDAAVLTTSTAAVAPTGTVTFSLDGTSLPISVQYEGFGYNPNGSPGYATLSATGLATFTSVGAHSLSAQYSGDANYAASTSPAVNVTVLQAMPSFGSYGAIPNSINLGQSTGLTAQLAGAGAGVPIPTGTMTFYDGGTPITGTITYTALANGLGAALNYTPTTAGTHNITVSYSGDSNYLPATSPVAATLTVSGPTPGFTVTANPSAITIMQPGQSASTTLTFTSQNGLTGSGGFSSSTCGISSTEEITCSLSSFTLPANGTATATLTFSSTAASGVAPSSRKQPAPPSGNAPRIILLILICGLAALAFAQRRKQHRWQFALAAVVFAVLFAGVSCGGGSSTGGGGGGPTNPGTPTGSVQPLSVSITINGTSQTVPGLSLTVQ